MDLYSNVAAELSQTLTLRYSTSFGSASKLYDPEVRPHIFNIYGWVRIGDEIVDSYRGDDAGTLLDEFKKDTYRALKTGFSSNPIIHSFAATARKYGIDKSLIEPYIKSMRMDIEPPAKYTKALFNSYIYGSAQVVGLMCLRVFTNNNNVEYEHLRIGAESLAAAFQKVNFLRDFANDTTVLSRSYFPAVKNNRLTEAVKQEIVHDIYHDFTHSIPALAQLPKNSRTAVTVAARYYFALLKKLEATPAKEISNSRIRVPDWRKAHILASVKASHTLKRTV